MVCGLPSPKDTVVEKGLWAKGQKEWLLTCHHSEFRLPYTGLNNKHLILTVLESGKSKIKAPVDLVSGRAHLLAYRRLPSPCVLTWHFLFL